MFFFFFVNFNPYGANLYSSMDLIFNFVIIISFQNFYAFFLEPSQIATTLVNIRTLENWALNI